LVVALEVFVPFAGAVIATVGTLPRLTVISLLSLPKLLEQLTVTVFAPRLSATELVIVLLEALPLTVQVVPPGMVEPPSTVYMTLTELEVVLVPVGGSVIATTGARPRVTLTLTGVLGPKALVQETVIVLPPSESATEFVLVLLDALPLTVQVVPPGMVVLPLTV
jgi:hypothetical protein